MPYKDSKDFITCPVCGRKAELCALGFYYCLHNDCNWQSNGEYSGKRTLDIYSGDIESACLSNLFPYKFNFDMEEYAISSINPIKCASMESFIQGLKIKDPASQKEFCENFSGINCIKLKPTFDIWQKDGFVYLNGYAIDRYSEEYKKLITKAYDCLYETNKIFREFAIPYASKFYLIHSIGKNNPSDTLLTEVEFLSQLNRLIQI